MKSLLYFLAFGSLALADIDFFSDDPSFTYSPTSAFTMVGDFGASGCGGQWDLFSQPASFTFKFPTSSTSFKWWGWKFPAGQGGQASVCLDGAKGSACATVNTTDITSSTPIVLFSLTGLSNTIHTVTVTNIPDPSQGDALGMLTVDHFSIDGTVSPPSFAQGTTLATVPMEPTYHIPLTLGGHSPPLEVLLDSGASANAWAVWAGCTQDLCQRHNLYRPSTGSSFFNFSMIDFPTFGDGSDNFTTWRVNDTVGFGGVTTTATFGAAFQIHAGGETIDGNFGLAKGLFTSGECVTYPNFVEDAFANGKIKNAVIALYQLASNDSPAAGVTSVAQLGGIDRNKFIGSIDWIPMNQKSMWQSPSQNRTVQVSPGSASIAPAFGHAVITFDTGDPGLMGLPTDDWTLLVDAVGAFEDNGEWWFPCQSTMSLGLNGNQGRTYTFALADKTNIGVNGLCGALANDAGPTTNWIMGAPFLDQYYLVFHYKANVMGLGKKNLAASAATTSVFIGQA